MCEGEASHMVKFSSFLVVLSLCLTFSHSTSAEKPAWQAFVDADPLTAAQRQELAQKWAAGFNQLNDAIPTLSPSEKAWLKREYDDQIASGKFTGRSLSAMNSREYNIRLAKRFASNNVELIGAIAGGKFTDRRKEALLWAAIADNLLDREYGQAILELVDLNVISKSVLEWENYYIENQQLQGQFILNRLVIPFLAGTQPD